MSCEYIYIQNVTHLIIEISYIKPSQKDHVYKVVVKNSKLIYEIINLILNDLYKSPQRGDLDLSVCSRHYMNLIDCINITNAVIDSFNNLTIPELHQVKREIQAYKAQLIIHKNHQYLIERTKKQNDNKFVTRRFFTHQDKLSGSSIRSGVQIKYRNHLKEYRPTLCPIYEY